MDQASTGGFIAVGAQASQLTAQRTSSRVLTESSVRKLAVAKCPVMQGAFQSCSRRVVQLMKPRMSAQTINTTSIMRLAKFVGRNEPGMMRWIRKTQKTRIETTIPVMQRTFGIRCVPPTALPT